MSTITTITESQLREQKTRFDRLISDNWIVVILDQGTLLLDSIGRGDKVVLILSRPTGIDTIEINKIAGYYRV
jgi:hypothetical protein